MNQGAQRHACRPLGQPRLGVIVPRGSRDVEMNPRRVAGKFLDEHRAGDGSATFAAANVLDVGDSALDKFTVFVKGTVADIQNIGSGKGGGAITGAMFIKEFTGDSPWIHLDIAGTAWNDDAKPWLAKGPTGVALRTLIHLVMSY